MPYSTMGGTSRSSDSRRGALLRAVPRGRRGHPLEGAGAGRRAAPFLAAATLGLLLSLALHQANARATLLAAGAAFAGVAALCGLLPWGRLPRWTQAVPPLAFFALIAVVRHAEGGADATFTPMLALPVLWFALYGTRLELGLSIGAAAVTLAAPFAIGGTAGGYPESELIRALSWAGMIGIAGFATSAFVSHYESLLAEVDRLARTDALTGLANRRAWEEQVRRELSRAARTGSPFSVAVLDLDGFKQFNDQRGHGPGDELLREAATLWSLEIREMDLIARHGGDEFGVLLPDTVLGDAAAVAERLRASTPRGVTVSAGVAEWDGTESPDELFGRADAALYEAKRAGSNRVCPAQPTGIALA